MTHAHGRNFSFCSCAVRVDAQGWAGRAQCMPMSLAWPAPPRSHATPQAEGRGSTVPVVSQLLCAPTSLDLLCSPLPGPMQAAARNQTSPSLRHCSATSLGATPEPPPALRCVCAYCSSAARILGPAHARPGGGLRHCSARFTAALHHVPMHASFHWNDVQCSALRCRPCPDGLLRACSTCRFPGM